MTCLLAVRIQLTDWLPNPWPTILDRYHTPPLLTSKNNHFYWHKLLFLFLDMGSLFPPTMSNTWTKLILRLPLLLLLHLLQYCHLSPYILQLITSNDSSALHISWLLGTKLRFCTFFVKCASNHFVDSLLSVMIRLTTIPFFIGHSSWNISEYRLFLLLRISTSTHDHELFQIEYRPKSIRLVAWSF